MSLSEFLLARIAEDRAAAFTDFYLWNPKRVLLECDAKARVVIIANEAWRGGGNAAEYMRDALLALTMPYADHPDYQQEWKP